MEQLTKNLVWCFCQKRLQPQRFKITILLPRGVAQPGSAPALGAGCRGFESLHPDHSYDRVICGEGTRYRARRRFAAAGSTCHN